MSNRHIWQLVLAANGLALAAGLIAGGLGVTMTAILAVLTIFVYLETFAAVLWYTMETRLMQQAVSQQAKLTAHSLRGMLYDSMRGAMHQINQLFVGNPHLRPFFYDGAPFVRDPQNDANTRLFHELSSVADCLLDIFESVIHNMQEFPDDIPAYTDAWDSYIRSVFGASPFLNTHLDRHPDWYVPGLQRYRLHHASEKTTMASN